MYTLIVNKYSSILDMSQIKTYLKTSGLKDFKNVSDFDGKQTPINLRSSYPSRVPESAIQIKDESGRQSTGK